MIAAARAHSLFALLLFLALTAAGSAQEGEQAPEHKSSHTDSTERKWGDMQGERIEFNSEDGVRFTGVYEPAGESTFTVVLVPMLGNPMESYYPFIEELHKRGIGTFVFDNRGHGLSTATTSGVQLDWRKFTASDYAKFPGDIVTAIRAVEKHDVPTSSIYLLGSGIGANAALIAAAQLPDVQAIFLMSPGEEIHRLNAVEAARRLRGKHIFILNGIHDEYAFNSMEPIAQAAMEAGNEVSRGSLKWRSVYNMHGSALLSFPRETDFLIERWMLGRGAN